MTKERQLMYDYFNLSYILRVGIAMDFGLWEDDTTGDVAKFVDILGRVKEEGLTEEFTKEVASQLEKMPGRHKI